MLVFFGGFYSFDKPNYGDLRSHCCVLLEAGFVGRLWLEAFVFVGLELAAGTKKPNLCKPELGFLMVFDVMKTGFWLLQYKYCCCVIKLRFKLLKTRIWWRRRGSNPRPSSLPYRLYMFILSTRLTHHGPRDRAFRASLILI